MTEPAASPPPAAAARSTEELLEDIRLAEEARLAAEASAWAEDAARLNAEPEPAPTAEKAEPAPAFELEEPLPAIIVGDEDGETEPPHPSEPEPSVAAAPALTEQALFEPLPELPAEVLAESPAVMAEPEVAVGASIAPSPAPDVATTLRLDASEMPEAAEPAPDPVAAAEPAATEPPAPPPRAPAMVAAPERRSLGPETPSREYSKGAATMAKRRSRSWRDRSQDTSAIIRSAVRTRIRWVPLLTVGSVVLVGGGALAYLGVTTEEAIVAPKKEAPPRPKPVVVKPKAVEPPKPAKVASKTHSHTATSLTPAQIAAFDAVQNDMASHRPAMRELPQLGADDIDLNREAPGGATIDEKVLKKRIDQIRPGIETCVSSALQRNPDLKVGKVNVNMTVGSSGIVTKVAFDKPTFGSSDLGHCIEQRVKTIVLPSFQGDPEQVEFPLAIASGG